MAEHARSLVFVDYGEMRSPELLVKGFYFLTGFGHEAVMVFFVISGYLVGGKVWILYREGRFGWRRYLADRLSRLYAVLFVALVLGAVLDWSGYLFFNSYGLYNKGHAGQIAVLGTAPFDRMGWLDFLVNAFFLQTIAGPPFGSNGPLWSLAYEWWYYILFPVAVSCIAAISGWRRCSTDHPDRGGLEVDGDPATRQPRLPTTAQRVVVGMCSMLMFGGLCWFLTMHILMLFGVWLLGVMAASLPQPIANGVGRGTEVNAGGGGQNAESGTKKKLKKILGRQLFMFFAILFCVGSLLLARFEIFRWWALDQFLIGIGFALLLVALGQFNRRLPNHSASQLLADFSYSVYLMNLPVLIFVISVAYTVFGAGIRMTFSVVGLAWFFAVFFVVILVSWLISLFTERKTAILRGFFYFLLHVR